MWPRLTRAPLTPSRRRRRRQTNLLERRLFYVPSFKIYGSVAGFYDYGPPGCAIKNNITQVGGQGGGCDAVGGPAMPAAGGMMRCGGWRCQRAVR